MTAQNTDNLNDIIMGGAKSSKYNHFSIVTSYDLYNRKMTHWVLTYMFELTAYPFETVGEALYAAMNDFASCDSDTEAFLALVDEHERGGNTFPNDDIATYRDGDERFQFLPRITINDGHVQ